MPLPVLAIVMYSITLESLPVKPNPVTPLVLLEVEAFSLLNSEVTSPKSVAFPAVANST